MFTETRSASPSAVPETAPAAAEVDVDLPSSMPVDPDLADLAARHSLPLVVLDIAGALRQYRTLRESFPMCRHALRT